MAGSGMRLHDSEARTKKFSLRPARQMRPSLSSDEAQRPTARSPEPHAATESNSSGSPRWHDHHMSWCQGEAVRPRKAAFAPLHPCPLRPVPLLSQYTYLLVLDA